MELDRTRRGSRLGECPRMTLLSQVKGHPAGAAVLLSTHCLRAANQKTLQKQAPPKMPGWGEENIVTFAGDT